MKASEAQCGAELFQFPTNQAINSLRGNVRENNRNLRRGVISEMVACAWLSAQGYDVFRNTSPYGDADIVIRNGSKLTAVDVKTGVNADGRGYLPGNRRMQAAQIASGVEILYVFPDGHCAWGRAIDPKYGQPPEEPRSG